MRKLAIVSALLLGLAIFVTGAFAAPEGGACGEALTWTLEDGVLTVSGSGAMDDFAPGEAPWSAYAKQIAAAVLEEGVAGVGENAFAGCESLQTLVLPKTLRRVGGGAFTGCAALNKVEAADLDAWCGVDFADETAAPTACARGLYVAGKPVLALSPSEDVTAISAYAFTGCRRLVSVNLPAGVKSIGAHAFENCTALETLNIADPAVSLGKNAFAGCGGITSGTLGEALSWQFQNGVLTVSGAGRMRDFTAGNAPWQGVAEKTESLTLKDLTAVGKYAFAGVRADTVTLPASLAAIGENAFAGIGAADVQPADSAAWCAVRFANKEANPLHNGGALLSNGETVTALDIPGTVTRIAPYAFCGCASITEVSLPQSVAEVGANAFAGCEALKTFSYKNAALKLGKDALDGCAALESGAMGDIAWRLEPNGTFTVSGTGKMPDFTQNALQPWACRRADVKEAVFSEGVESVGAYAFYGCEGLSSFTLADSVAAIGAYAFGNCLGLKALEVPDTVSGIGSGAFAGCVNLQSAVLPFIGASADKTEKRVRPFGHIFGWSYASGGKNEARQSVYESEDGKAVLTAYFNVPESLKTVTVTGGEVRRGAFENCRYLETVTLNRGVGGLGAQAFMGCERLKEAALPRTVVQLGDEAFAGCVSLAEISLPQSLCRVGDKAFSGCEGLAFIAVPPMTEAVGAGAFENCAALRSVTLGCAVRTLGAAAFAGCPALESAEFGGSEADWAEVVCGEENEAFLALLRCTNAGHDFTDVFEELVPATCLQSGTRETGVRCFYCGKRLQSETETLPPLGHSMTDSEHLPSEDPAIRYILRMICVRCGYCEEVPVHYSSVLRGDVDENGRVTAADARLALRAAVRLEKLTDIRKLAADVNGDGRVTAADARTILRIAVRLEK